jgi:hypothetical protein
VIVLRRGAQHRRAADVDVLDRVLEAAVRIGDRRLERIEVDDDEVDRLDARARIASTCAGWSRRARMPPWIFGCSVFTRPSSISGSRCSSILR